MNPTSINGIPLSPADFGKPYVFPLPKGWKPCRRLADLAVKERKARHHTRAEWRRIYNGYLKTGACRCPWDRFINNRRRSGCVIPTKTKRGSWK